MYATWITGGFNNNNNNNNNDDDDDISSNSNSCHSTKYGFSFLGSKKNLLNRVMYIRIVFEFCALLKDGRKRMNVNCSKYYYYMLRAMLCPSRRSGNHRPYKRKKKTRGGRHVERIQRKPANSLSVARNVDTFCVHLKSAVRRPHNSRAGQGMCQSHC